MAPFRPGRIPFTRLARRSSLAVASAPLLTPVAHAFDCQALALRPGCRQSSGSHAHLSSQVIPGFFVSSSPTHFAPTCPAGREGICTPDTSLEEESQPLVDCVNSTRPPAYAKTITNTGIRFRRVGMGTLMGHVQFFESPLTLAVAKPPTHPSYVLHPPHSAGATHALVASQLGSLSLARFLSRHREPCGSTFRSLPFLLHRRFFRSRVGFRSHDKVPTRLLSTTPQQSLVSVAAPLTQQVRSWPCGC